MLPRPKACCSRPTPSRALRPARTGARQPRAQCLGVVAIAESAQLQEVAARGGRIILIADQRAEHESSIDFQAVIAMAEMEPDFAPIVYAVPVQQIAYYTAVHMGKDVDQPRNLAKSVTVE